MRTDRGAGVSAAALEAAPRRSGAGRSGRRGDDGMRQKVAPRATTAFCLAGMHSYIEIPVCHTEEPLSFQPTYCNRTWRRWERQEAREGYAYYVYGTHKEVRVAEYGAANAACEGTLEPVYDRVAVRY